MQSKPPESKRPPTPSDILRRADAFRKSKEPDSLVIEGYVTELSVASKFGENPNSGPRFVQLLSSIPPIRLSGLIPGESEPLRKLIERLSAESIHEDVRSAACRLLAMETRSRAVARTNPALPTAKRARDTPERALYPHPDRPPLKDQAVGILREHIEGNGRLVEEADLRNAIEVLKSSKENDILSLLAHVASMSPIESVKEKAREAICNF